MSASFERAVLLVGSGRMAEAFARALARGSRGPAPVLRCGGRELAAQGLSRAARRALDGARERAPGGVLALLAVTDAAVAPCAEALARAHALRAGDAALHLAGLRGPGELAALARGAGVGTGALHPLVAVSDPSSPPALRGLAASHEGDAGARRAARWLARRCGLALLPVTVARRDRYHAAAALVATGAVALAQGAARGWLAEGVAMSPAQAALAAASLLSSVAHNVRTQGAERALASPLLRGDVGAVARHLDALDELGAPGPLYAAALAQVLQALAAQRAVPPAVLAEARSLLRARGLVVEAPARA